MITKARSGRWRVRVKHHGRVVADRTFDRKADASRWEAEQRRSLDQGDWLDPRRGDVALDEVVTGWLAHRRQTVAQRTWESDRSAMRIHVLPAFGRRPARSITRADVARFAADLSRDRSPKTVARIIATFSALMVFLVEDGRLRSNPVAGQRPPNPDKAISSAHEIRPFPIGELFAVVETQRQLAPEYAELTLVLGLTGLRFGELRGLRVGDVLYVPYPALRVARSVPASGGGGRPIVRDRPKSGRARTVPLADVLLPVIQRRVEDRAADELLFTAPQGGWLVLSNWRRAVRWSTTAHGRRPHDLRHTAATAWLAAGIDVKTVQTWLGHASAQLTLNLYGHHMGTDADRAGISRMNAVLGDATGTQPGPVSGPLGRSGQKYAP